MNKTKQLGLLTELSCQLYISQLGYNICTPLCEDCRYDMIVDFNGILKKIQVKTCHENNNKTGVEFPTISTRSNSKEATPVKYSEDDVDYFATFYNNKCYLVKNIYDSTYITLLYDGNATGNECIPRYLSEYECEKQINKILSGNEDRLPVRIICQYDKNYQLIATYKSARDAARALGDETKNSHISNAINGRRKTAYGFYWEEKIAVY